MAYTACLEGVAVRWKILHVELRLAFSQFVSWQCHSAFEPRGAYVEEDARADQDHAQCSEYPKRLAERVGETEVAEPLEVSVCGRRVGQSQQTESEHGQSAHGAVAVVAVVTLAGLQVESTASPQLNF